MIFFYLLYYTGMCLTTNQSQSYSVFFKSWRQIRLRLPAPIVVTSVPIYIFIRHFSLVLMGASFQIVKGNILGLVAAETKVWLVPVSDRQKKSGTKAEPVEPKFFEIWSRRRNYLLILINIYCSQFGIC